MAFVRPAQDVINRNRTASNAASSSLRYPSEATSHSMIFNFKTYENRGGLGRGTISASNGSIALPLPANIDDITTINIASTELGIAGVAVGDAVAAMKPGTSVGGLLNAGKQAFNDSNIDLAGFALLAVRTGLASLSSGVEQGIGVATGTAVNPHQALVFNGVALKQHTFDWTLIPNNESESNQIRNIIKKFKQSSLPSYEGINIPGSSAFSRALFKYPNMVDVFFVGLDQNYFPLYKTAMIADVSVNYTPQGHVVVNKGSTGSRPAMVALRVTMIEAEIHTSEDYQ
jgi:hypothetical protein